MSKTDTANVKNTATITTGPCIPSSQCTSTVTNPVPNFTVKKTDVPGTGKPVVPGAKIPYTVTVKNTGSGAGSAVLKDTLASNLALGGHNPEVRDNHRHRQVHGRPSQGTPR